MLSIQQVSVYRMLVRFAGMLLLAGRDDDQRAGADFSMGWNDPQM